MPEAHRSFHSASGKRRILISDHDPVNRDTLKSLLHEDFEVVFAKDEGESLRCIKEYGRQLSLILLDPDIPAEADGPDSQGPDIPAKADQPVLQHILQALEQDPETQDIPVIALLSREAHESDCLNAGAIDCVSKPCPDADVVLSRIRHAIELSEDRKLIESTERDSVTDLYTRDFFFGYAQQYDQFHPDTEMDAIVLDINHFSIISERYGRSYADDVLRRVGRKIQDIADDSDGMVCFCEESLFYLYCPHRNDYKAIFDSVSRELAGEHNANNRVRLRMGIYSNAHKSQSIEQRFHRAKMAADSVRNSFTLSIGLYDDTLRKPELYAAKLLEGFRQGLEQEEFKVYYQPKYDIRTDQPVLSGAEALVRWEHPERGLIGPDVFIPLFEEHGLIQELDRYVWEKAARQISIWKDRFGFTIPVSVNVSRIDMYDSNIIYTLMSILERNHLESRDLHLELTESAYEENSNQIIEAVKRLRAIGFTIELDDFGTGHSSLNMLNTLPIDILKLDMFFIRSAFSFGGDTQMLEMLTGVAETLSVPVIAEGVEEKEQLRVLQEIGCDLAQGFFFSPPVPADEFEPFMEELKQIRQEAGDEETEEKTAARRGRAGSAGKARKRRASGKSGKREPKEAGARDLGTRFNISLRNASVIFVLGAFITAVMLFMVNTMVSNGYQELKDASERFIHAEQASNQMVLGSDYLTEQVRLFIVTGAIQYMTNYFRELNETQRRDKAVDELETLLHGSDNAGYEHLTAALRLSNDLVDDEYHAMKLTLESGTYDPGKIPKVLKTYSLSPEEEALSDRDKKNQAQELVLGDSYRDQKSRIRRSSSSCTKYLIATADQERAEANRELNRLLHLQTLLMLLLLLLAIGIALYIYIWVRRPINQMLSMMKAGEAATLSGATELRSVSEFYNTTYEENLRHYQGLSYRNMHDPLTGLYDRRAYDLIREDIDMSDNALLLVDVDQFRSINSSWGHDTGDQILRRVARVLEKNFRASDLIFRLGGDEFVIIMTSVDSSMANQVEAIIEQANIMLQRPVDDLPPASVSVGVAFSDRKGSNEDIFRDADAALYRAKQTGHGGCCIY